MSNLTPFEIRLELLKMAKDLMLDDYQTNVMRINEDWHTRVDVAKINGGEIPNHPGFPTYPTESDIVKKAQELNGFVSNTDVKSTSKKS